MEFGHIEGRLLAMKRELVLQRQRKQRAYGGPTKLVGHMLAAK